MNFSKVLYCVWFSVSISYACGSSEVILSSPPAERQTNSNDCVVCLDKDAVVCNINCGHITFCEECYWLAVKHSRLPLTTSFYQGYIPMSCPTCRATFSRGALKVQRPIERYTYPCKILGCEKTAEYFHMRCGNLILCSDCYQRKIYVCPACNSNHGHVQKIYLPVEDYTNIQEFTEREEMEYRDHEYDDEAEDRGGGVDQDC